MTDSQKREVRKLRVNGAGYKSISSQTGISVGAIRAFLKKEGIKTEGSLCLNCKKSITSIPGRKKKKFCSRECGLEWWHSHSYLINKKALYTFTCLYCGESFTSYGQKGRKYCSHKCYIRARFGGNA